MVLLAIATASLTYKNALKKAVKGKFSDSVIEAFWREHHQAELSEDLERIKRININLGELLLDLAKNKKKNPKYIRRCAKSAQSFRCNFWILM